MAAFQGEILKIREHPELAEYACRWFESKWGVPCEAYEKSMEICIAQQRGIPQWYAVLGPGGEIIAGAGIIDNDFHNRKDLSPNLCALFVEKPFRGQGIARSLLALARQEAGLFGFPALYLVTDHTEFYEKCGWQFETWVTGDDGCRERLYSAPSLP